LIAMLCLLGALLVCVLAGAWGAGSARADSFSAPYRILPAAPTPGGTAAQAVSCPSATQCTAISSYGPSETGQQQPDNEVTFDPATSQPNAAGLKQIDSTAELRAVSCPTTTQCTAFDAFGHEVTFDPATGQPNAAGLTALPFPPTGAPNPGSFVNGTCPSVTQCTGIAPTGEITFDPTTGKANATGYTSFGNFAAGPVSCPSMTQCTTVTSPQGNAGTEITFDPITGADPAGQKSVAHTEFFTAVSCPSAMQCTAATFLGGESGLATFDPITGTPNAAGTTYIAPKGGPGYFGGYAVLSCPSVAQCTEVADGTPKDSGPGFIASVTVDPVSLAGSTPAYGQALAAGDTPTAVACATASQCVAVLSSGLAVNITPAVSGGGSGGGGGTGGGVSLHGSPSGSGGKVRLALNCAASSSACRVTISLKSTETTQGNKVLGVSAAVKRHRTVGVGTRTVKIVAGKTTTVTVTLNATGRRLLARFHRLPVRLRIAVAGRSGSTTRNVTVRPAGSRGGRTRR
jgi:hypothetical protein